MLQESYPQCFLLHTFLVTVVAQMVKNAPPSNESVSACLWFQVKVFVSKYKYLQWQGWKPDADKHMLV